MTPRETDVRGFVLRWLTPRAASMGIDPSEISDDFALMESGLINSMDFVDLIAAVESEFACEIDFEEVEASRMTILGGFVRLAAQAPADE